MSNVLYISSHLTINELIQLINNLSPINKWSAVRFLTLTSEKIWSEEENPPYVSHMIGPILVVDKRQLKLPTYNVIKKKS